jgi:hypothetical protein
MKIIRYCFFALLVLGTAVRTWAQCPPGVPPGTNCVAGIDAHGAFYLIAVPANYNGRLVVWDHGYTLLPPAPIQMRIVLVSGIGAAGGKLRVTRLGS